MKKYFGLLGCLIALNACDDGDMVFDSFDFDETRSASDCGLNNSINTVFKINDNEALILKIDGSETFLDSQGNEYLISNLFPFRNQINTPSVKKTYTIGNDNKVIYRVFNGTVSSNYFCSQIPPTSPTVIEENSSSGSGKIEITTSIIPNNYPSVAAIKYRHSVMLRNITFSNNQGSTTYEEFYYGIYERNSNVSFAFNPLTDLVQRCTTSGKLIKFHDRNIADDLTKEDLNEVLEFFITDEELASLPANQETPLLLSDTRKLTYKIYSNDVSQDFLCSGTIGTLNPIPVLYDEFVSENGTPAVGETQATGRITITKIPIANSSNFTYSFVFNNVRFKDADGITTFTQTTHLFGSYVSY